MENKIKDMKLRLILLVLSLLTFLSASTGGYLYYSSLKKSAFQEVERQAATHAEMIKKNLSSFLSENIKPSKTLAGMDEFHAALTNPNDNSIAKANTMLDHFSASLNTDVCHCDRLWSYNRQTFEICNLIPSYKAITPVVVFLSINNYLSTK